MTELQDRKEVLLKKLETANEPRDATRATSSRETRPQPVSSARAVGRKDSLRFLVHFMARCTYVLCPLRREVVRQPRYTEGVVQLQVHAQTSSATAAGIRRSLSRREDRLPAVAVGPNRSDS